MFIRANGQRTGSCGKSISRTTARNVERRYGAAERLSALTAVRRIREPRPSRFESHRPLHSVRRGPDLPGMVCFAKRPGLRLAECPWCCPVMSAGIYPGGHRPIVSYRHHRAVRFGDVADGSGLVAVRASCLQRRHRRSTQPRPQAVAPAELAGRTARATRSSPVRSRRGS